ncbi:MAG TPA: carboxyl transferase domain-containing protein [Terriglobales bacterium]|jgi:acetyl/propionyl-CoA carboxylase alpha subunit/acetyl-CoA carboxylase carboxyltransferase component|nr:carboxyl transferase domain-containing protein [Terriglobales bacterium]
MQQEFQRVAIVNRGEAAMRFIHAAREFNHENGMSLRTIALFTDPDRHAMFVREADEAVSLGPAHLIDASTGHSKSSYVDYGRLERALAEARAEAVWVGWGFVAEHAEFADLCREIGVVFIGPDGDVMRRLGDKIASKLLAEQARIPVAPWSGGPVETLADAQHHADRLGYPLLIKATAGGGGHGIRRVHSPDQLAAAFESARNEAFKAFGNPTVFMEQLLQDARHVEVQIIADHYGTTWAAGVRDCTIQRRHQKILEEAPSPALSPEQDESLREAAVRLSQAAGYHNAGTVEFLYQPETQRFSFMEMNTRLQVEHPVTECTTGLDLVKLQIHVARGGRLEGAAPRATGHAIEVRLNAENPENGFAPAPGAIERFRILTGPGVRIDTGVVEGDSVPAEFDSMIAKIIAYGHNRKEALSRLQRALRESVVVIKGGTSNKAFLLELLNRADVQQSTVDIGWLDRLSASGEHVSRRYADVALVAAAVEAYDAELAVEQTQFYASAVRGRPQARNGLGRSVALRYRGHCYAPRIFRLGPRQYRVDMDGSYVDVRIDRLGQFEYWLTGFGKRFHVVSVVQGSSYEIEVDGVSHRIDRDDGGLVHAPAPAVVVSIAVRPGDTVSAGDRLAVLEAMKMEMQVVAPFSGKVRCVMIIPNVQVDTGAPLLQIDPATDGQTVAAGERVLLGASRVPGGNGEAVLSRCRQNLKEVRQLLLGFDVDPAHTARLLAEWSRTCPVDSEEIRQGEDEILNIFVDICSLFQRQPEVDDSVGGEAPSAEAYLFSYLRMIETRGEELPSAFVEALRRALAHYGVTTLERSPELEESLLWIYKSHQRVEEQIAPILAVLERRLRRVEALRPHADESFRTLLDRMISIIGGLFPAVSDLAREVRYRYFDQPLFERARKQIYEEVEDHLTYLAANPEAADRHERVRALVECPQPMVSLFARRLVAAAPPLRQLMLEVLTWRYYRIRMLTQFRSQTVDGHSYASADYDHEGKHIHVFTTHAEYPRLTEVARALFPLIEEVPADHDVVLDFYVWHAGWLGDPDATQQEVRSMLNQVGFTRPMRRIVVAIGGPSRGQDMGGMQHFTYRPNGNNAYEEEKFYRGLHPMMGKRLHLWRLNNFNIERLPSVEDVYFLRAVARDNPKDERLFACAEVRDLTPVRDETGRIVQLPHLERMFAEALAAIRLYQSRRKPQERLCWNRILLYVWPPLNLKPDELNDIVHKLIPATEGLGLEQVVVRAHIPNPETGELRDMIVRISSPGGRGLLITFRPATKLQPIKPLTEYDQKVVRMRQRGFIYPYEIIKMLTPAPDDTRAEFPPGDFVEHDLDSEGRLVPVDRPYGQNKANIIVGIIRNFTTRYPEGMTRVLLLGDPGKDLGALAEAECRRIIAALDLAEKMGVPLEWFPISAGAKISMDSGVENMDWIARVLRRLVGFTQGGGEVNLLIDGINVGAQPYWNAEATMLMHTRGILVMTPKAAMVLTGKRALDYSGGISAEDNQGIGGYDRIMGLNGQAQYWARDIDEACHILFRHYEHTYVAPGERFPRQAVTADPIDRDVRAYPHGSGGEQGFTRAGDIFSDETNPGRKKSFDIRRVMMAVVDQDHAPLERWPGMRAAEIAVVWDAHLGGNPVCLIGIESRPVPRIGFVPADGPDQWCAGTLFPLSSKKVARAINAASNNRPVVILANLSGFDGSPESMRKLQLEYGAEIGRAVVNFKGPMIFCVISRYHGGAYVVFSRTLNEQLEVVALEGAYASVIGGAPAAAVVFASEVAARARKDPRLQALTQAIAQADGAEKGRLRAQWDELFKVVHSEKLGEVADEFDRVHSVQRALKVGALHRIIPPATLRPYLIHAVECAMGKEQESRSQKPEAREVGAMESAA